jgi:hypothetical protein
VAMLLSRPLYTPSMHNCQPCAARIIDQVLRQNLNVPDAVAQALLVHRDGIVGVSDARSVYTRIKHLLHLPPKVCRASMRKSVTVLRSLRASL